MTTRRLRHLTCAALAAVALTAACSAESEQPDGEQALRLPADVVTPGTLTVAADIAYPPNEFLDEQGDPQGVDVDLAAAIADELGADLIFQQVAWDAIIGEIADHRSDLIMSSMTDTAERQQELTFVDYLVVGSQMVVPAGNPAGVEDASSLCGLRVTVQAGTTHLDLAQAQSRLCRGDGHAALEITETASMENLAAVTAGRADVTLDDYPVAAHAVAQDPSLELAGRQMESAPYGIGVAQDRPELLTAVQTALQRIIADGTYDAILDEWSIEAGALRTTALDGGV